MPIEYIINYIMQENTERKPSILFIGMPDMATVCLNKLVSLNFNIKGIVPPDKNNSSRFSIIEIAKNRNIPVYEFEKTPNEPEFVEKIKALNCDIGIICSFGHKLSKDFLNTTKDGFINCHPSLLPDYRGANPYFHIINNGEKTSGITVHFADEHFDTGSIIAQETFSLVEKETMGMLFSRTNFMMAELLGKVLIQYKMTGQINSTPQKQGDFIKAPNIKGDFFINWSYDILKIERLIRAANPFYNVLTNFRGGYIRLIAGNYKQEKHNKPFGQIVKIKKDMLQIAAKDGYYFPNVIQAGTWGIYAIEEFIEKFNPNTGEILK